ncbi:AraC family transcriptional regulator [Nocardioides cavernaquae]|uniref:AraC family transcriptional regulator n=1 Tax=Nocardioides cavernaquae TaxID=2321396 RepID=A0A3A5HF95_9ACTN|nr:AraC family transcriptional regulator [Nocardioides cavernaquae]RJS46704.1 AraC family transcriptional regulator [Nocardioides cavernaquae]
MSDPRSSLTHYHSGIVPREIIARDPRHSFRCIVHDFPSEICGWASHPEYEIHLIQKSSGSVIAGDYVGTFEPGHVSLMGPHLPHDWVSDLAPGEVVVDRDVVVHFTDEWVRASMDVMPELGILDGLLQRSARGLEFHGESAARAGDLIRGVVGANGPTQIARLIELLGLLAQAPADEVTPLASEWLGTSDNASANLAAEAGLAYIFDNLTGDIRMSTAASLAHMSEPTFSKYFRRAAGTTFSTMVKRLRIAHARRLLDTTEMSAARVAVASGYNNMSNFNRQFLAEVGLSPTAYRKLEPGQKPAALPLRTDTKAAPATPELAGR